MEFKIDDANFTAVIDGNGFLTSLTAEKDETLYNCSIKLTAQTDPNSVWCCLPNGQCQQGGC